MKFVKYIFFILVSSVGLYVLLAYIFMFFPSKNSYTNTPKKQTIYILYSPMHTDIVINIENSKIDWNRLLPEVIQGRERGYLGFGWGDKETYLNTPTWDDLKISTALKALFFNTPSLLHVGYYRDIHNYQELKEVNLTQKQFKTLEQGLKREFYKKPHYEAKGFGKDDAFYTSKRVYNVLDTCNTWSGDRLREANISMSYWTPFSFNVVGAFP